MALSNSGVRANSQTDRGYGSFQWCEVSMNGLWLLLRYSYLVMSFYSLPLCLAPASWMFKSIILRLIQYSLPPRFKYSPIIPTLMCYQAFWWEHIHRHIQRLRKQLSPKSLERVGSRWLVSTCIIWTRWLKCHHREHYDRTQIFWRCEVISQLLSYRAQCWRTLKANCTFQNEQVSHYGRVSQRIGI